MLSPRSPAFQGQEGSGERGGASFRVWLSLRLGRKRPGPGKGFKALRLLCAARAVFTDAGKSAHPQRQVKMSERSTPHESPPGHIPSRDLHPIPAESPVPERAARPSLRWLLVPNESRHSDGRRVGVLGDLIAARPTFPQDWPAYNAAQVAEGAVFDDILRALLSRVPDAPQTRGPPRLPRQVGMFHAVKKVHTGLSSRRAQGLMGPEAPHFNTASDVFNDPEITPWLYSLVTWAAKPVADVEETWAIDSTGFRTSSFGYYMSERYGARKKTTTPHYGAARINEWLKAHFCVGAKTNVIATAAITGSSGPGSGDTAQFEPLFMELVYAGFPIKFVVADKAYSSRKNIDLVYEHGGTPFIPFKGGSRGQGIGTSDGSPHWKKKYREYHTQREAFNAAYHQRSNVEATNHAVKAKLGETLRSRKPTAQKNELLAKVVAYNIGVIVHEMHRRRIPYDRMVKACRTYGRGRE